MSATAINICATRSGICPTLAAMGATDEQLELVGNGVIADTDLMNLLSGNIATLDTASGLTVFNPSSNVSGTAPAPAVNVQSSATDLILGSGGSVLNSVAAGASSITSSAADYFSRILSQLQAGLGQAGTWVVGIVTVALVLFLIVKFL